LFCHIQVGTEIRRNHESSSAWDYWLSPYLNLCCQTFPLMVTWKPSSLLETMLWFCLVSPLLPSFQHFTFAHFHRYKLRRRRKNTWHLLHVWRRATLRHPSEATEKKSSCVVEEHFTNTQRRINECLG
jgi:hypothetical protein